MFSIQPCSIADIADLRQQYLDSLPVPLDGMWQSFVNDAAHHRIEVQANCIGYCSINHDNMVLQFWVNDSRQARRAFTEVLNQLHPAGAFVATCEDAFLAFCLDHQQSLAVHSLMYQLDSVRQTRPADFPAETSFRVTRESELQEAVAFAFSTLGCNKEWLQTYYAELIHRQELFGLWQKEQMIATGECRVSDLQPSVADLGMIVSRDHRRQGIATSILRRLIQHCRQSDCQPICSTEAGNLAAQSAITRSGFLSNHRILQVRFRA